MNFLFLTMNVHKVYSTVYARHRIIFECIRIYVSLSRMFKGVIGCPLQMLNVRRYVDSIIEFTFNFYEGK